MVDAHREFNYVQANNQAEPINEAPTQEKRRGIKN